MTFGADTRPWEGLERDRPCAAALGLFDGVHWGHREILRKTCEAAERLGVEPVVFSFKNHPRTVLNDPGTPPPPRLLVTSERRVELMKELGISTVLLPEFTLRWAETPAEVFARDFLVRTLKARHVVVGFNYCFGRRAEGRTKELIDFGTRYGFTVEVVPPCRAGAKEVSSTRIRNAILQGDLIEARELLGRPHELSGTVVPGRGRGRKLGFPTANLEPDLPPLLPQGVYCVLAVVEGEEEKTPGMFFLGPRKTFGEQETDCSAEVHLFDTERNLYGKHLRVEILAKIRDGMQFQSPEDLAAQLQQDKQACLERLAREYARSVERGES